MLSKKKVEKINRWSRKRVRRIKTRKRRAGKEYRHFWFLDHRCLSCHSQQRWCPCGDTRKELCIRKAIASKTKHKNAERRRCPKPNPRMVPLKLVSRSGFLTCININELFSSHLVAKLRAAGFIERKGHWSSKAHKRWKRRFERRAAFFATEEGRAQSICAIAEAMLCQ